ncbi:hypothetical protein [Maricaulis sp.]|uniref:hypothetical protein n=1 Tax=Maricaulis sp. TaxID=1486257 RepID=UPI002620FB88|nr:hypothetical protein [Maricaulis sp.]
MKKLGLGLALLAVAGCSSHTGTHEHVFHRGIVPVVDTDDEARSMCSATSYEQDRNQFLASTQQIRRALGADVSAGPGGNDPIGVSADSFRSPELYNAPPGNVDPVVYLVAQFEAELDGSYDSVVQNCRAYNQCMIRNDYTESACSQSQNLWSDSQVRFHNLADRLADVRAEVARSCGDCVEPYHYRRGHRGRDHHDGEGRDYGDYSRTQTVDSYYGPFSAGDGQ